MTESNPRRALQELQRRHDSGEDVLDDLIALDSAIGNISPVDVPPRISALGDVLRAEVLVPPVPEGTMPASIRNAWASVAGEPWSEAVDRKLLGAIEAAAQRADSAKRERDAAVSASQREAAHLRTMTSLRSFLEQLCSGSAAHWEGGRK